MSLTLQGWTFDRTLPPFNTIVITSPPTPALDDPTVYMRYCARVARYEVNPGCVLWLLADAILKERGQ